jgi:SAM-dependent methyltransferase
VWVDTSAKKRVMLSDHERHNREFWDADADEYQAAHATQLTPDAPMGWGVWHVPEREVAALGDVRGRAVLELGCGAAQWSIQLAAAGARPVGLDLSVAQLGHARREIQRADTSVPLVQASGERVPFRDASFDIVFCDHGAMSFCEPEVTVPEVARLLRAGGRLVFNATTPLVYWTYDSRRERQSRKLHEAMFGRRRWEFDDGTVDYAIPNGEWIRLFREHGLVVDDLIELRPPKGATTTYLDHVPYRWARRWPAEQIWNVRKP